MPNPLSAAWSHRFLALKRFMGGCCFVRAACCALRPNNSVRLELAPALVLCRGEARLIFNRVAFARHNRGNFVKRMLPRGSAKADGYMCNCANDGGRDNRFGSNSFDWNEP